MVTGGKTIILMLIMILGAIMAADGWQLIGLIVFTVLLGAANIAVHKLV